MSSPVLHIKDSYFFEVPRSLYRPNYESMDDVPGFLHEAHPHATLQEFNAEMAGKILIPQPFAKLKNLFEVESGLAISKYMLIELLVAFLIFVFFFGLKKAFDSSSSPRGRVRNLLEAMVGFVRDQLARPALGKKDADKFVPYLLTVFFFVLGCNLIGMFPFMGTATSDLAVTGALAFVTFFIGTYAGIKKMGVQGYVMNFIPHMDLPGWISPLKYLIMAIEILGTVIKHSVLAIRLFANMVAGHMVLAGILGTVIIAAETMAHGGPSWQWYVGAPFAVVGSALFSMLELLVAFLQAYVFTMLSSLFISSSIHHH